MVSGVVAGRLLDGGGSVVSGKVLRSETQRPRPTLHDYAGWGGAVWARGIAARFFSGRWGKSGSGALFFRDQCRLTNEVRKVRVKWNDHAG